MHKYANIYQKIFFFSVYLIIGIPAFILRSIFFWNKGINKREIKLYLRAVKDGLRIRGGKIIDYK